MHPLFVALSLTSIFIAPCFVSMDARIQEQENDIDAEECTE
ncbi:MAG: hypothetical protein P4L10_05525 [Acidobacteriaceae bacterium]|nr:hypothetical protein [Acidobacteriaceae bacterium]